MREASPCYDRDFGNVPATFKDFRQLSRDFETSPKMSPGVPKMFEHSSEATEKMTIVKM